MSPARDALERELRALHDASYGWALSLCDFAREAAVDVLQESYLRVLDGRARFAGGSAFRTFFFGVVRQVAREHRRRERVRSAFLALIGRADPEVVELDPRAESTGLREALSRLPARQRETMLLVFWQELTLEEAATVLGISLGSVRQHYARGKEALRRALDGKELPDAR